ncbi:CHASE domain-containing protein [bacterium]|nr:CHASE domain-containing protein [bacterium]
MIRRKSLLWLIVIGGLGLSFAFYIISKRWENTHIETEVEALGRSNFFAIREALDNHIILIQTLKNYLEVSYPVSRSQFKEFVGSFLKKFPTIQALEWIPLVKDSDRDQFESSHRFKDVPGFQIRERVSQGKMVRRKSAEEYFPVTFIEPLVGNENAIGFDLASSSTRKATLQKSRESGQIMATARITLVQEKEKLYGFLLIAPVFKKGNQPNTIEFKGFSLGGFRIGDLIKETKREFNLDDKKLKLRLLDLSAPIGSQILFSEISAQEGLNPPAYKKTFPLANRSWQIQGYPTQIYIDSLKTRRSEFGALIGIIFTILLASLYRIVLTQTEAINQQVKLRTSELSESNERTQTVINTVEDGIITIDQKGRIAIFNPAAEKLFQYQAQEVLGMNVKILMPEPFHSHHDVFLNNYVQSRRPRIIGIGREVMGKKKDGSTFPMRLAVGEMKSESESLFVGIITDITKQKIAEQDLMEAKEQAEQANRVKSDFLNTMSHELRTPLTVILGNIDELTEEEDLPEADEIVDIARDCSNAGNHLMRLINDLLDISKIEAGKMVLLKEKIDSAALISEALNTVKKIAEDKGLKISSQGDEAQIEVDSLRIKQVLLNLLSNAIKFTEKGDIQIQTKVDPRMFTVAIKDTGWGMEQKSLEYVFEPFRQVDSTATRKTGGSGLGLAITKKLIELHGGNITVNSQFGQGSTFTFTLPIDSNSEKNNENTTD